VHGPTPLRSKSLKPQLRGANAQQRAAASYFLRRWSRFTGFLIGKNRHGHWVVLGRQGLSGGLFASEKAARAYALSQNGNQVETLKYVPDLELTFHRPKSTA
jgi:hypothetical protein